jgi:hypothetical protein
MRAGVRNENSRWKGELAEDQRSRRFPNTTSLRTSRLKGQQGRTMKLTSVCLGAFVLLVQTLVGSSQGSRPQLLIDPVEAPVFIQEFNYVESEPPLVAAVLRVIPTSREKITAAAILITYWRQGRPVAGRIYPVYENVLTGAVPLRIRLDFQRTRADSVVASVFKAQGPTLNWVLPSEHLRSLGQRLFPGASMPQAPPAETAAPEP